MSRSAGDPLNRAPRLRQMAPAVRFARSEWDEESTAVVRVALSQDFGGRLQRGGPVALNPFGS